jgi:hypothetical protein
MLVHIGADMVGLMRTPIWTIWTLLTNVNVHIHRGLVINYCCMRNSGVTNTVFE